MRLRAPIGLLCSLALLGKCPPAPAAPRWLVYYSNQAPVEALFRYDILVLDSDYHPPLRPLAERGKALLGYLSLGEAEDHRSYFRDVKADGIFLQENQNWKGGHFVDLRDRRWTERVLEQIIPGILRQGFNGLFLDTLDNAVYLESQDPRKYAGMKAAAAALVRAIRERFPALRIMLNRGYELLPEVETHIDMVLGESVFATYDFSARKYQLTPRDEYLRQVDLLKAARQRRPGLMVFTLDYWNPEDPEGIRRIYRTERAHGFLPYVATIKLDRIVGEPGP